MTCVFGDFNDMCDFNDLCDFGDLCDFNDFQAQPFVLLMIEAPVFWLSTRANETRAESSVEDAY